MKTSLYVYWLHHLLLFVLNTLLRFNNTQNKFISASADLMAMTRSSITSRSLLAFNFVLVMLLAFLLTLMIFHSKNVTALSTSKTLGTDDKYGAQNIDDWTSSQDLIDSNRLDSFVYKEVSTYHQQELKKDALQDIEILLLESKR